MTLRQKWWAYGSAGALLFGSGLSIIAEASHWKHDGSLWYWWVFGGVVGIALAVSGVVFLIRAGILQSQFRSKDDT